MTEKSKVDQKALSSTDNASRNEKGINLLLDIPLQVSVEVGRARILVRDLLQMQEGTLIELEKLAGEPLDLYVNSRLIARGEAVVVNEKFGLRLTDVVSPSERIENLGS
ncbi:MAG: flagellar motor switch protein FliN [Deltaproteobacteria bacterium]|nr:flagellar motor switch protein FliN [Deltaproteobacteria bacterium]NCP02720.1 flagellar motor switch protein FliN [Deltaproteobacteria bacterium]NCP77580.1 flagellar motor switch protein FliN [Desulfuromonadales bacterium]